VSVYSYTAALQLERMSSLLDPWAVRAAATLRLPDLVAEGADTTSDLATRSETDPDALNRLMRHLQILGLFCTTADDRWELTELGELLRDDHPLRMRRALDQTNQYLRKVDQSAYGVLAAVRAGGTVWDRLHGLSFWDDVAANPELGRGFGELMASRLALLGPAISRSYDWTASRHIIDVGGGTGRVLASILGIQPDLHGTLVDLPSMITDAAAVLEEANVADRCVVVPQSFFDVLPRGGDVYLLANILHNWNDENSAKILRRCAEAAGPGGRVLLVERVVTDKADENERVFVSTSDLSMLLLLGGKERTEDEFHQLALMTGVRHTATHPLAEYPWMSLLEYTVNG
jgi:2,7-dihydroxy-5-methyl-1-naphthoate 7-O-methyltransferase